MTTQRATHPVLQFGFSIVLVGMLAAACGSEPTTDETLGGTDQSQNPASDAPAGGGRAAPNGESMAMGGAQAGATARTGRAGPTATSGSGASGQSAAGTGAGVGAEMDTAAEADAGVEGGSGGASGGDVEEAGASGGGAGTGSAGTGGVEAEAGAGGSEPMADPEDLGKGDGSDVITIGDSWMSYAVNGGGIEGGLNRAGTNYRNYGFAGTQLLNGQIPGQYDQAKRQNPDIKTIIMTGGGNDVMFSGGCSTKEACTAFSQMIADSLDELWMKAEADGVSSAVYIQYSRNAGTAPEETRPDMPAVPKICSGGTFRCVFISTTDLIERSDTVDGIHPTSAGCDRIAKRVLEEMEKAGVRR